MVGGVDMAVIIGITLKMIIDWLELSVIPMIIYTNLYSLYKCLVKLNTMKEKRLMINIMAFWQSYKH